MLRRVSSKSDGAVDTISVMMAVICSGESSVLDTDTEDTLTRDRDKSSGDTAPRELSLISKLVKNRC